MPRDNFLQRKQDVLLKIDKSSKCDWDKKIVSLCKKINSSENYYTTSSCSGRVAIMIDQEKKGKGLFLKRYHDLISFEQLKKDLTKITKDKKYKNKLIKFKQEPCILHVACKSFDDAEKIYEKAKQGGWKRSGIIASGKRFVVEMNGTEKLEFPVINKRKILVEDNFLKLIVKKSNKNLEKSWKKIEKMKKLMR